MPVTKPRNRTVIFRLTEDEYMKLMDEVKAAGARSPSEHFRAKLLEPVEPTAIDMLKEIQERLRTLNLYPTESL